jgi:hypothetical protein
MSSFEQSHNCRNIIVQVSFNMLSPEEKETARWGRHGLASALLATFDPHACPDFVRSVRRGSDEAPGPGVNRIVEEMKS